MKPLIPYLFFDGNCREAMVFYQSCLGGKLDMQTYGQAPQGEGCPEGEQPNADHIMHAMLSDGEFSMMASDNPMNKPVVGDNVSLCIECETKAQTEQWFQALSAGGNVTMPLADTFWGAYFGMLVDKYGFHWMLNCHIQS